jgi:large subunit ribosomal protein L16
MLLQPKEIKYKKVKKGKLRKFNYRSNTLKFGTIGLKAVESGLLSARQLESARQAISRRIKRDGKLWLRVFPDLPITSKPLEVRMGKGKGNVDYWSARVRGGTVLFELCGVRDNIAKLAFKTGAAKLCIRTKIFV